MELLRDIPARANASLLVSRQRVLEKIRRRAVPITALIAPAGFGKSHIAQRIARLDPHWCEVDCAPGSARPSLAQQLAAVLGIEGDVDALETGQLARMLGVAWQGRSEPLTLVVENGESLEGDDHGRALVAELLQQCPPDSKLIFCGRHDPAGLLSDFSAPHLVTTLRRDQLAFDDDEMRALFAATNPTDAMLYRVGRLTEGWPVPALSCARMAQEGTLAEALADLGAAAFRDLFDFVDGQVLAKLPPQLLRGLCAAAGFDDLRTTELDQLFGEPNGQPIGTLLCRKYQLASDRVAERTEVGPLIRAVVCDRYAAEVRSTQLTLAAGWVADGQIARAAQCYVHAGEIAQAAELIRSTDSSTLDALCVFSSLPDRLDRASLPCYPEVWAALIGARRLSEHPDVLAHEAQMVLASLGPDASAIMVDTVVGLSTILLADAGRIGAARAMLERGRPIPQEGAQDAGHLHILAARATLDSREGKHDAALATWHTMQRYVLAQRTWFSHFTGIEIVAARARGQWEVENQMVEQMLSSARKGGAPAVIGTALAEGLFGAWLAGEDDLVEAYRTQLALLIGEHELPQLLNFSLAASGRKLSTRAATAGKWDACAYIMAAADDREPARASDYAVAALAAADTWGGALLRILARVAVAEKVPSARRRRLDEALEIVATVDSVALRESVRQLNERGEPGAMLTSFVNRLRSRSAGFEPSSDAARLQIWISDGSVERDGAQLDISEGSRNLLTALAIEGRPAKRDALCDKLWPELPLEAARNALKMCVRRTRLQVGDAGAIVSFKGGYLLGAQVEVDLRDLTRLRAAVEREGAALAEFPRAAALFERLRRGRPATALDLEWFESTEHWLQRTTVLLGEFIARDALQRDDNAGALQIGEYLTKLEPFDEAGPSLSIAAHLASKRRGAAVAEYGHYRKVLDAGLGVEPSMQLKELLLIA
jgi:DNA-binding SARP family transcriptional activator